MRRRSTTTTTVVAHAVGGGGIAATCHAAHAAHVVAVFLLTILVCRLLWALHLLPVLQSSRVLRSATRRRRGTCQLAFVQHLPGPL